MGNWLCGHNGKNQHSEGMAVESVKSKGETKSILFFLHGLGDTGRVWSCELRKVVPNHCKIVCPNAPAMEVSINQNAVMPAWYDISSLAIDAPQDETGIKKSVFQITKLIEAETEALGVPMERVVLGGFSQGGSVALYAALTAPELRGLGGVLLLSSWLPLAQQLAADPSQVQADKGLAILQCHGASDPLVPFAVGSLTSTFLRSTFHLTAAELHKMPDLGHSCNEEELQLARDFLARRLDLQQQQ